MMPTNNANVNIDITARDRASSVMNKVKSELSGLESAAGTVAKGFSGLAGAFAVGAITQVVGQVGSAVVEMSQLAAQSQQVESAFRAMQSTSGESADAILAAMRRASGGTVSDVDLMLNANKAMMLGVASNTEELTALMNVAASRGRAMGLSMQQAFGDIVTGLGRGSALILDNLGIVVDAEATNAAYAASLGKTTEALTEAEKKQALVNQVMKEAATIAPPDWNTPAADFERMNVAIQNAKTALGELFSPAVAAIAQSIANAVEGAMDMADQNRGLTEAQVLQRELNDALQRYNQLLAQNAGASPYRVQNQMLEEARRSLAQLVVDYNLAAMQTNRPIIDYSKLLAGAADFYIAAQQYNPAGLMAEQAEAAQQASNAAFAQMGADAQAFASQNTAIWEAMVAQMEGLTDGQLRQIGDNARAMYAGLVGGGATAAEALAQVVPWINSTAAAMRDANASASDLAPALGAIAGALPDVARWLGITGEAAAVAGGELRSLAGTAAGAALGLSQAGGAIKQVGLDALAGAQNLSKARSIIAGITEAAQAKRGMEDLRSELARYNDEGLKGGKTAATLQEVAFMSYPAAAGIGGVSDAVSQLNQEFESLRGKAQGVLSGALNLEGINIDSMLPREDAINENARRLAAIANEGFANQSWLPEFEAEVPDIAKMLQESGDPKAAAAQLLRDFQDGLVPQLLDKEQAKERVRRMLLGDQNMSAMAAEIAQELSAEMGISMQQAQQAAGAALGVGSGKEGTGGLGLDGATEADNFVTGLTAAIAAKQASLAASGSSSGAAWGSGFLAAVGSGVPPALIDLLVVLITPKVAQQQQQQGTRTGAS